MKRPYLVALLLLCSSLPALAQLTAGEGPPEMELAIWKELLLQATVVATAVWLLTEFAPFGAKGGARRGMAVVYSMGLTFAAYLIGAVRLPDVIAPEFSEATWPRFFILAVVALLTAAETMIAHDVGAAVLKKKDDA